MIVAVKDNEYYTRSRGFNQKIRRKLQKDKFPSNLHSREIRSVCGYLMQYMLWCVKCGVDFEMGKMKFIRMLTQKEKEKQFREKKSAFKRSVFKERKDY